MPSKSPLKWFLRSLVGGTAILGFMMLGQLGIPILINFGSFFLPDVFHIVRLNEIPEVMQIGGMVAIALAVFLAVWKRQLSVLQSIVSLAVCYMIMMVWNLAVCLIVARPCEIVFGPYLHSIAFASISWLIGVGVAVGLNALKKDR